MSDGMRIVNRIKVYTGNVYPYLVKLWMKKRPKRAP